MSSDKYKLKWSKYESNVLNAFRDLFETEALSDVTLFCEGQTFRAHRFVLSACSTHFESLFSHTSTGPITNQLYVILDGTRADDLQILLNFMYRGEAYLHQDRINSVLRTAEALQIKGLSEGPRSLEMNTTHRQWSPTPQPRSQSPSQSRSVGIMGTLKYKSETQHFGHEIYKQMIDPADRSSSPRNPYIRSISPTLYHSQQSSARNNHNSVFHVEQSGSSSIRTGHNLVSNAHCPPRTIKSTGSPPPREASRGMFLTQSVKVEDTDRDDSYEVIRGSHSSIRIESTNVTLGANKHQQQGQRQSSGQMEVTRNTHDLSLNRGKSTQIGRVNFAPSPITQEKERESGHGTMGLRELLKVAKTQLSTEVGGGRLYIQCDDSPEDLRDQSPAEESRLTIDMNPSSGQNNFEQFRGDVGTQQIQEDPRHPAPKTCHVELNSDNSNRMVTSEPDYVRIAQNLPGPEIVETGTGTKMRCPFCERTYGYETNLRAHIRQRHQGIRVSCPYCPRTFTRNNTVRRHVQREHRNFSDRLPTKFSPTRILPDPIHTMAAAVTIASMAHQDNNERPKK